MTHALTLHARVAEARSTGSLPVLLISLSATPVLLVGYALHYTGRSRFADARWDVDTDLSYIEILGYAFLVAAAALLLALFLRRGAPVYAGWAAALVVLVADDALQLHEHAGRWLDRWSVIPDPPGLRVSDIGELGFWACTGVVVATALYVTHRRSSPTARRHSHRLAGLLVLLMAFAVGVDMLHIVVKGLLGSWQVDFVLISIEGAGELGVMACMFAYALHITRLPVSPPSAPNRPYDWTQMFVRPAVGVSSVSRPPRRTSRLTR